MATHTVSPHAANDNAPCPATIVSLAQRRVLAEMPSYLRGGRI